MPTFFERVTGRNVPDPDAPDVALKCIFCNISPERDFRIVAQNDQLVVFRDKYPAATVHLLVTPRIHIPNTSNLGQGDVDLVKAMHAFGIQALDKVRQEAKQAAIDKSALRLSSRRRSKEQRQPESADGGEPECIFGFHVPPFRSVDHLHLHCLQMPYLSKRQGMKYPISEPSGKGRFKGTGWFVTADQAVQILEAGEKIGFGPC